MRWIFYYYPVSAASLVATPHAVVDIDLSSPLRHVSHNTYPLLISAHSAFMKRISTLSNVGFYIRRLCYISVQHKIIWLSTATEHLQHIHGICTSQTRHTTSQARETTTHAHL